MKTIDNKLQVLSKVAILINDNKITWAIGGSVLLYFKGFVDNFNDIDMMVIEDDVDRLKEMLLSLGKLINHTSNPKYRTRHFYKFNIDGVEIDIIAGFTIINNNQTYYFPLLTKDISEYVEVNGSKIPLHSIHKWRLYYELMGRSEKAKIIDNKL